MKRSIAVTENLYRRWRVTDDLSVRFNLGARLVCLNGDQVRDRPMRPSFHARRQCLAPSQEPRCYHREARKEQYLLHTSVHMFVQLSRAEHGFHHKLDHSAGFSTYSTKGRLRNTPYSILANAMVSILLRLPAFRILRACDIIF